MSVTPRIEGEQRWPGKQDGLTERESQVIVLCAEGLTNKEIADRLYLNVETVKSHLKGAYSRLGLHNRAQAAAFAHRTGMLDEAVKSPGAPGIGRTPPEPGPMIHERLELDEAALDERLALMDLTPEARARLAAFGPMIRGVADDFVNRLEAQWLALDEVSILPADHTALQAVLAHQHRYLIDLFTGQFDDRHVEDMLSTGAMHHRLRLPVQWYLASHVHVIVDALPMIFEHSVTSSDAIEATATLISSVLFDAGLVLDAYELCVADEILLESHQVEPTRYPAQTEGASAVSVRPPPRRSGASVRMARDEASQRSAFVGIDADVVERLAALAPAIDESLPAVLADFYALVASTPSIAALTSPDTVQRLLGKLVEFWSEASRMSFDRLRGMSRMRVGVIHERIGLTPQFYLAGLGRQLAGVLRALTGDRDEVRSAVDAIVRAAFFDLTFVIDAYLEARAATLLQTGQFAGQLVAGLANGVVMVDGRNRVEFANDQLVILTGVPATMLYRMPIEDALALDGVSELLRTVRESSSGRVVVVRERRGRQLRVIAVRLQHRSPSGHGDLVALMLDDISDVLRLGEEAERDGERLDQVLAAVQVVVWELHADTFVALTIRGATESLFGLLPTDLLGRTVLELLTDDERDDIVDRCRALEVGERQQFDHHIRRADGTLLRVRTSVVAGSTDDARTLGGVTVEIGAAQDVATSARAVMGELARAEDALRQVGSGTVSSENLDLAFEAHAAASMAARRLLDAIARS
jgi:DNA-binding CsgD family transcriptional regulator